MDIARLGWFLVRRRELEISRFLFCLAVTRFDFLNAFIGRKQPGFRANAHSLQTARLRNVLRRIMLGRGIHHIHPYWQRYVAPERAAKNSLRLVEPGPDRAGNRAVVSCEKHVSKIVSSPGFAGCLHFLQTEVRASPLTGPVVERVNQTRVHLVSDLVLDYVLFAIIEFRSPS